MSPTMSRTATSPRRRTATFGSFAVICHLPSGVTVMQVHDQVDRVVQPVARDAQVVHHVSDQEQPPAPGPLLAGELGIQVGIDRLRDRAVPDRKSTRLNSSHPSISYAVFCL